MQIPVKQNEAAFFRDGKLPVLLYAGQISNEPDWSFPSHKHDNLSEIIYISEGQGRFIIGNRVYRAAAGDMLIYNQGEIHEEYSEPEHPLKTYFCGIGNLLLEGTEDGCLIPRTHNPLIHAGGYSKQIEYCLSTIFEELKNQIPGYQTVCQHTMIAMIVSIIRIAGTQRQAVPIPVPGSMGYKIKEYIDTHYTQDIPLTEIANRLYISPHYLSHIFKHEVGTSPIHYLIQRRMGEAKRLLLGTSLTIAEIAEKVGYENANYFSLMFRRFSGESPTQFRKRHGVYRSP